MITNVCEGAIDKMACITAVVAQDSQNSTIKLIAVGCFSLLGLIGYLVLKKPDVHVHKKEINPVPESTLKKVVNAGLSGLVFGIGAYAATGIIDFAMKISYIAFGKYSIKGHKL